MLCLFATLLSGGLLLELRGDKQQMFVLTRDANFHTCKWLSRVRTKKKRHFQSGGGGGGGGSLHFNSF